MFMCMVLFMCVLFALLWSCALCVVVVVTDAVNAGCVDFVGVVILMRFVLVCCCFLYLCYCL